MNGYGDPNAGGLGFGDPNPDYPLDDLGFGDPYYSDPDSLVLYAVTDRINHTGGAEVVLKGEALEAYAPFQITVTVDNKPLLFHSGYAGQSFNIYPNRDILYCYAPPAPVGVYTLKVKYGVNFSNEKTLSIQYVTDNKGHERYHLRSLFPAHFETGARASILDPLDEGSRLKEESALQNLTDTIGRVFQELAGVAMTRTRSYSERASTFIEVESVLGFPSQGYVWVANEKLKYTLNQTTKTLIVSALKNPIRELEAVYYAP
jgi:hypothetical protein